MAEGVNVKLLGEHLRRIRREKKLRLRQVYDATGISIASLSRIERGGSHGLDSKTFITLTKWMNMPVEMFRQNPELPAKTRRQTSTPDVVELHLRADRKLDQKTADALAKMFRIAYDQFSKGK